MNQQEIEVIEFISFIKRNKLENNPAIKRRILQKFKNPFYLIKFCKEIFKNPCEEFEEIISQNTHAILHYAQFIKFRNIPEIMHNKMLAEYIVENEDACIYFDCFKKFIIMNCDYFDECRILSVGCQLPEH